MHGQIAAQAEMIKNLRRDSMIDPLTGALNHKGLEAEIKKSFANAQRHKRMHTVLFIDLDNFKEVNKQYGRYAGDEALCHVYELLRANVRQTDIIARLNGDEFCIILNDVRSLEDGVKCGEKLCNFIESSPVAYEGENIWLKGHMETQGLCTGEDMTLLMERMESFNALKH